MPPRTRHRTRYLGQPSERELAQAFCATGSLETEMPLRADVGEADVVDGDAAAEQAAEVDDASQWGPPASLNHHRREP